MALEVQCPHCRGVYTLRDEVRGKTVRCKKCEHTFVAGAPPSGERSRKADGVQGQPPRDKAAPRRERPRDDEVLDVTTLADERPKPKPDKSSAKKVLIIVGSVVGLLFLTCAGVGAYAVYRVKRAAQDVQAHFEDEFKKVDFGNPHDPGFDLFAGKPPANLDEALGCLRGPPSEHRRAASWLARQPRDEARQAEVAAALGAVLADPTDKARLGAVQALKVWGTKDNVPALVKVLQEVTPGPPVGDLQTTAMEVLGKLQDERGAEPVAAFLPRAFTNENARAALQAMGPVAEKGVLKYFHHPDGGARERAQALLKGYGTKDSAVVKQSAEDLRANDANRRRRAAEWLAGQKADPALSPLVARALEAALRDGDDGVSQQALRALGNWATAETGLVLVRLVEDSAATPRATQLRHGAMDLLAKFRDERAVPAIAVRLTVPQDRGAAARALPAFGAAAERELRAKYLDHPDRAVRDEAARILVALGSRENVEVRKALADLKSPDPGLRRDGAARLGRMPADQGSRAAVAEALQKLLEDRDQGVREHAARALVVWATRETVPALAGALADQSSAVRHACLDALGKLKDETSVPLVTARLLVQEDRRAASNALKAMGPVAEKEVVKGLTNGDKNIRLECCRILDVVGTRASVPALTQVAQLALRAKPPERDVANAAQAAAAAIAARR